MDTSRRRFSDAGSASRSTRRDGAVAGVARPPRGGHRVAKPTRRFRRIGRRVAGAPSVRSGRRLWRRRPGGERRGCQAARDDAHRAVARPVAGERGDLARRPVGAVERRPAQRARSENRAYHPGAGEGGFRCETKSEARRAEGADEPVPPAAGVPGGPGVRAGRGEERRRASRARRASGGERRRAERRERREGRRGARVRSERDRGRGDGIVECGGGDTRTLLETRSHGRYKTHGR